MEPFSQALLDALHASTAILDARGTIVGVNHAWRRFASENAAHAPTCFVGVNYLGICDRAQGMDACIAAEAASGIRAVLAGQTAFFLEYPCHSPAEERWFEMWVSRFADAGQVFALVAHENVTVRKRAERERDRVLAQAQRYADQLLALSQAALVINTAPTVEATVAALTEQARQIVGAHQAVTSLIEAESGAQVSKAVSLSERYARWCDDAITPTDSAIAAEVRRTNQPMRLTQAALERHPLWRGFDSHINQFPPIRGWLAVPLVGHDGRNFGVVQLSDHHVGEFTAEDEAILVQLAQLASVAIGNIHAQCALRDSEARLGRHLELLQTITDSTAEALFMLDAHGRATFANPAAERMFGWTKAEFAARRLHDILHHHHPDGRPYPVEDCQIGHVFASGETLFEHEDVFFRRDGGPVHVLCFNAPIVASGAVVGAVLVAHDITGRKQAEDALRHTNEELRAALLEREVLLREIHHRVKNNLQLVASLLHLQVMRLADAATREPLRESLNRVSAIGAVHDLLYRSHSLAELDCGEFLRVLVTNARQAYGAEPDRVLVEAEADPMRVGMDAAIPIALIVNELLSNAYKHAFPDGRGGRVRVSMRRAHETVILSVEDDGVGLPRVDRANSLGLLLVEHLVRQASGRLTVEAEHGARFLVSLPAHTLS